MRRETSILLAVFSRPEVKAVKRREEARLRFSMVYKSNKFFRIPGKDHSGLWEVFAVC